MGGGMTQKKRAPLSIFEIMGRSISPDMKPCDAERHGYVFKSGLIGPLFAGLMFSNLDTFIEKPFPILFSRTHLILNGHTKPRAAHIEKQRTQNDAPAMGQENLTKPDRTARAQFGTFTHSYA
jgi:hypothetical protein